MNPQQLLIEAFVEECLVEMKKQKLIYLTLD